MQLRAVVLCGWALWACSGRGSDDSSGAGGAAGAAEGGASATDAGEGGRPSAGSGGAEVGGEGGRATPPGGGQAGGGAAGEGASGSGAAGSGAGGSGGANTEGLPGDAVFHEDEILDVRLSLDPAVWNDLEEHGNREEYVLASGTLRGRRIAATEFVELGVRHKGAYSLHHCWDDFDGVRSYAGECRKLSYKLKFDEYTAGARFDGLKRINLHAASGDATKLRELIAYRTFREFGVDAPRAVPARLTINGQFQGLFIAVEDIDGRYTAAHFPEGPNGNLYKETWPNPAASDADFEEALETNEDTPDVSDMRAFAEAVGTATPEDFASVLEPFVDIDALLRYIAVDRALRNWDGIMAFYSPLRPHNFFWYHDDGPEGRFHLVPWDLDNTLWAFDPYMHPEQWVTAAPVPDFNSEPLNCNERPVWEPASTTGITPPRCDALLDLLAEQRWERFEAIGTELLQSAFTTTRLATLTAFYRNRIADIVAEDPTLDALAWEYAVQDFALIQADAVADFEAFLGQGLIQETVTTDPDAPTQEELDAPTLDAGLHVGGITNFEFAGPPAAPEPVGTYGYADPLATFGLTWNTVEPLSGTAELLLSFTFNRGPETYDEWANVGIASAETDVRGYERVVVWLASDRTRNIRIRVESPAYVDTFGGIWGEFGVDEVVTTQARAVSIPFLSLYYPEWAKIPWTAEQGFPGTDEEARDLVLSRFTGLTFGPAATVDDYGELVAETETGFLRIDNIYFR
jgi:spore coat protein H